MVLPKSRRKRRTVRKNSMNKRTRMKQRRTTRRQGEAGGLGDAVLIAHLFFKVAKRINQASMDKAISEAIRQAREREAADNARSIREKTVAASATPKWGTGMPNPPKGMEDAFDKWCAADRNISASGVINSSRFSKFFVFLTEQLDRDPRYVYKLNDEDKPTPTATRR